MRLWKLKCHSQEHTADILTKVFYSEYSLTRHLDVTLFATDIDLIKAYGLM
jgi:hypothetical protein